MTALCAACACVLFVVLWPGNNVEAQEEEPLVRSNELFDLGKQQQRAGNIAAACESFAESQKLQARPGTLLNLGLCHELQGLLLRALDELQAAQKLASEAGRDDRVALTGEHIRNIEAKLAQVEVRAAGKPGPFEPQLWVDGEATSVSDERKARIVAGPHTLEVEAVGFRRIEVQLAVAEGSHVVLTLLPIVSALEPAQVAAAASGPPPSEAAVSSTPPASSPWQALRTASWIVAATGVGASLVLGAIALEQKGVLHEHCDGKRCDSTGVAAAANGGRLSVASNISFAVGAAGALSWLLLPGGWLNPTSERAPTAAAPARRAYW